MRDFHLVPFRWLSAACASSAAVSTRAQEHTKRPHEAAGYTPWQQRARVVKAHHCKQLQVWRTGRWNRNPCIWEKKLSLPFHSYCYRLCFWGCLYSPDAGDRRSVTHAVPSPLIPPSRRDAVEHGAAEPGLSVAVVGGSPHKCAKHQLLLACSNAGSSTRSSSRSSFVPSSNVHWLPPHWVSWHQVWAKVPTLSKPEEKYTQRPSVRLGLQESDHRII